MSDPQGQPAQPLVPQRLTLDGAIEIKQAPSAPKGKDWWDRIGALAPFVSGALVAVVGYFLTDSVNTALKREQLTLSNVTEMRALLLALEGPKPEEWRAAAFTLSAFGAPAVPPLVSALTTADEVRAPIIEASLRGVGLSTPGAVCPPMVAVLDNRTGRYTYLMHQSAIRLIGDLGCREAAPVLTRYASVVAAAISSGNLAPYQDLVDPNTPVTPIALELIDKDLKRTVPIVAPH
jgi:hypothetical protein